MNVLELFKGGGSITDYFKDIHIDNADNPIVNVISLDIEKKYNPSIVSDIMEFDYKQYPVGYFDIIWASPEFKIFSQLLYCLIGKKWKYTNELEEEQTKNSKYIHKKIEII